MEVAKDTKIISWSCVYFAPFPPFNHRSPFQCPHICMTTPQDYDYKI